MAETPDSGAAAAPAPTSAAASTPRGQRQQQRQRRSRGVVLALAAVGVAAFTAFAVWLNSSEPPYVTHREVMAMAVAIENAQSLAELQALADVESAAMAIPLPPLPDGTSAASVTTLIWGLRSTAHYTFLGGRDEQTERPRLLFRAHTETVLLDYHELRVARDAKGHVKVVDFYAMSWDRWCSELLRERERMADALQSPQVNAFDAALASRDAAAACAAYAALPEPVRASVTFAVQLQRAFPEDEGVRDALRLQHRDSLAIGFGTLRWAQRDSFANKPSWLLNAALQVLPRIYARTDDDQWSTSLRSAMQKALGAK